MLAAIVDECQCQCVLLDDGVDPIVRRSFEAVDALATPKRKRPCCCATGSLCWTVSVPTSTRSWAANGSDWLVT
jgi:hypothetical protein